MIGGVALNRGGVVLHEARAAPTVLFGVMLGIAICVSPRLLAQDCASATAGHDVEVEYERDGAAVGIPTALRFRTSHDGTLRAEDVATGGELWAFRPPEAEAAVSPGERMTRLAVLRFDSNRDGVIDPSRRRSGVAFFRAQAGRCVLLRAGCHGQDAATPWRADSSTLHGLGDAWSTPTIARVRVGGARQNGEHLVLFVGGGLAGSDADGGNAMFMLDAASGRVLWTAGNSAPANFISTHMTEGLASRIVAIDYDGDQFADRV